MDSIHIRWAGITNITSVPVNMFFYDTDSGNTLRTILVPVKCSLLDIVDNTMSVPVIIFFVGPVLKIRLLNCICKIVLYWTGFCNTTVTVK